ncbi:MAG: O-antigen ligase family protein [Anaerolineae bacterium]|nr:O-antigen ligase family protein [Anaerolineae bacterium]
MPLRRTPLDVPLVAFLLTAGLGVWTAYDRVGALIPGFGVWTLKNRIGVRDIFPQTTPVGWQALWGVILAVLVFYAFAAMRTKAQHRWALALLAGLGAMVAVWFAAANDWTANEAKLSIVTRLGVAVQTCLPVLSGYWLNTNILGGVIAVLIPASFGLVAEISDHNWKQRWPWVAWGLATGAVMALGLVLTTSRGGWMGVGISLVLAALWLVGRLRRGRSRLSLFLCLIAGVALVAGVLWALLPPLRTRFLTSYTVLDRAGIFVESALLVRDYLFTGYGLGEFAQIHSMYALLIHVPILPYAHSLYLDIALGQGMLGILAALGVLGGAVWLGLKALACAEEPSPALIAGLLSLVVMLVHGLVDDPLYISQWLPLLWVPAGLAVAGWREGSAAPVPVTRPKRSRWRVWGTVAVSGAVLLGIFWRPIGATWFANLGAVYQTWAELSRYDDNHFDRPTLDEIRRQIDLSSAERFFLRALALDPGQVTARTRLAEIALSRGQYDQALMHARAAWEAGHRDRVTRLLFGDALVAAGEVEEGVDVVRGLEWAEGRLDFQAWYRYSLGQDYQRAADAWRAVVALDPQNERAMHSMAEAEARAKNP